jgi:phage protein D
MDITALEKKYADFYAPVAKVLVKGKDLIKKGIEITSITVDNTLEGADQFTFVVNNAFDIVDRKLLWLEKFFETGTRVEIKMGYLDKLKTLMVGLVTNVKTDFPASGLPQFTISGYDLSYRMMKNRKSRQSDDSKDSDIVQQIAKDYGLKVVGVEGTKLKLPRIEQNQETDFQFLTRLARQNGYEFFVFQDRLYFKKPSNDKSADITLEWGKGLVSFSPEINLAKQVKKVKFYGWNPKTKKPIIGSAGVGDEPGRDGSRASGGELLQSVVKGDAVHRERLPVYSQQEADRRARGKLKKASEDLLKGRGESIGIPELLADKNIELKGLGKLFNRTYYIEKTQHTVTAAGYKTTFNVKETTV